VLNTRVTTWESSDIRMPDDALCGPGFERKLELFYSAFSLGKVTLIW